MERITTLVVSLLIATATFAQVPQGFSYQAVARDAQNAIVANQTVDVTITILQGTDAESAKAVFCEKHSAKTNANGLFSLTIGSVDAAKFSVINWAEGSFFLKTESDYGTAITQLLSVPFAIYAAKAGSANVDLSDYALKSDIPSIPTKTSDLQNDSGFLTAHQDLSAYALKTDIPTDANLSGYYSKTEVDALLAKLSTNEGTNSVSITAGANGIVKGASGKFYSGQSLTYTAVPNDGYYFSQWSDANTINPRSIIIYSDTTLTAEFAQNPLITVTAGSNGTVSGSENGRYAPGCSLWFTATPSTGYYFNQWSDGSSQNPRYVSVYRSDITFSAEFAQNPLVTITAGSNGSISGFESGRYAPGSSLSFSATPSAGYYFSQWSDGSTQNPRYVNVYRSDITFSAEFVQNPLVTVTAGSNGTVGGSESGRYAPGSSLSFSAPPSAGYYFSQWSDGNTDNPRTITVSTNDITLTAEFVAATIATVDLGLTSGNLWATCNVGAINPWNYGNYYAWGETETKSYYHWSTYKYCDGSGNRLNKYCSQANYGYYYPNTDDRFTDDLTTLESADDAAKVAFGANYSMPTTADWNELSNQCYWVWTNNYNEQNVSGYIVYRAKSNSDKGLKVYSGGTPSPSYSLSDAHIFLPEAGFRVNSDLSNAGDGGEYWSSSLNESYPYSALLIGFDSDFVTPSNFYDNRCYGFSVRPVIKP